MKQGFVKDDSHEIYMQENRFLRALRFLFLARRQSFVPEKITSLISAMESLLSTSNSELKFQVSSRACKIIGGDLEEKKNNYDIIREAYDLRSAYVHGGELVGKYRRENGKLTSLATNMDDVMRKLMKELIENHSELAEKDTKGLGEWFTDLMLK
ncbi:HEPN domain-containing protein [Bacillus wiedmannii]|nr:HEPN domain-containing protein [Bacillus wiedmannii]